MEMEVCKTKGFLERLRNNKVFLTLIMYIGLIFCFEPKIFVKYNICNMLYVIGLLLSFALIIFMYLINKKKPSSLFILVVLYRASFFIQTFLNERRDLLMWGYMSIALMTLCLIIDFYAKDNLKQLINALIYILTAILTINLIIGFVFPKGIKNEIYFIGIRTRFTDLIFPLIACSLINMVSYIKQGNRTEKTVSILLAIYVVIISILTIIKFKIATAIVGVGVFIVAYLFFIKLKPLRKIWIIVILALLLNYLLVFLKLTDKFGWLISEILGESTTLTGRTGIWEAAIEVVRKKILFGHGMAENGGFVWWSYDYVNAPKSYWQSHNQWLQILYDGGLLTLVLFVLLIISSCKNLKNTENNIATIFIATLTAFLIMMIVEIYSYTPYLFVLLFIGQHLQALCKENKTSGMEEVNQQNKVALIAAYNDNYGSLLQVYATQQFLNTNGYNCEIINYKKRNFLTQLIRCFNIPLLKMKFDVLYRKFLTKIFYKNVYRGVKQREEKFNLFRKNSLTFSDKYETEEDLKKALIKDYKFVVLGSDQVWNPINIGTHFFTMELVPDECFKITYAPSFGVKKIPFYQKKRTKKYLQRIQKISVRESAGQKIVKDLTGRDVPVVCDPTLLVEKSIWKNLVAKESLVNEKYLFCYFLGKNPYQREIAKKIAIEKNLKIVTLKHLDSFIKSDLDFADYELYNVGPAEFIKLIVDSEYVFTDSFHGTIFSMLNHKRFLTFPRFAENNKAGTNSRIENLLTRLSVQDRFVLKENEDVNALLNKDIDWNSVDAKIEEYRTYSKQYFIESIKEV